jgi:hypothetical protein
MDLEQLAGPDEVADRHRLDPERLGLATAAGSVSIALELDELGKPGDQPSDFLCLAIGQPLVRDGDGVLRLSVHMGQRQATGIDDTVAAGDRLKSPRWREAALRYPNERDSVEVYEGIWPQEALVRPWTGRVGCRGELPSSPAFRASSAFRESRLRSDDCIGRHQVSDRRLTLSR